MKEIVFLNKNKEKWQKLENSLSGKDKLLPDRWADYFVQLTDDLSYARTFYPESKLVDYLNQMLAQIHREIYKNKKQPGNRFLKFWRTEVPQLVGQHFYKLLFSFIVFLVASVIGWFSATKDAKLARLILGDFYVNTTINNIENGEPMAIYAQGGEVATFLSITLNNIKVALLAFVLGFFLGIGTFFLLFSNGMMLGVFLQFFYQRGLVLDSFLAVWMHGTIEIAVIIVAGQAGFVLANGILFPKSYPRIHTIKKGAMDGIKIVIALVPLFIIAGFIEGFFTRHYNVFPILSAALILASLSFVIFYFAIWPLRLHPIKIAALKKNEILGIAVFLTVSILFIVLSIIVSGNFGILLWQTVTLLFFMFCLLFYIIYQINNPLFKPTVK